ncbi:MAG: RNA ligase family protein [Thermoactinomyces sp.]
MDWEPIIPFEPVESDTIPQGDQWIAQVKWDGVRICTYWDGNEVKLFNRRRNERTYHYPELLKIEQYINAKSAILDGEVIALKNGKPSFYEVMKRDGIRDLRKVPFIQQQVPVTYMIFDILYLNHAWVVSFPLADRLKMLQEIYRPGNSVQLVTGFEDGNALFEAVQKHDLEGIVLKDLSSSYLIHGKDRRWIKKKNYHDLIAVVGGVTFRHSIVNSLLLGLFDEKNRLWYIGHAGTGKLTQDDWQNITRMIRPLFQDEMPFANKPSRSKDAIWVKPLITVKIKYTEWIEGHTLRQPSIQAFVKIPPHQCRLNRKT